jgi:hypothetical protein
MTIENAPGIAEQPSPPPALQTDPNERIEPAAPPPPPPRRSNLRRTALAVLVFTGKAMMIAMATIVFLIVLAFVLDDPDPVRSPSQSASMRY